MESLDPTHWTMTRSEPVELPHGKPIPTSIRGFMWAVELIALNNAAYILQERGVPGGCLEIGSYAGLSACALAQPGPLTCIDTFTDVWGPSESERYTRPEFDLNMAGMGLSPRVFEMNSHEALPLLAEEQARFRLIHIDGDHSYKGAFWDISNALPMLSPGGIVAVDDSGIGAVRAAAEDAGIVFATDDPMVKLRFGVPL